MVNLEQTGSPIPGHIVCKTYISIKGNFLSYQNWKQNQKTSNTVLILLVWIKVLFLTKNNDFLQKTADISKVIGVLH